mmetsp:Transcript_55323/g.147722  ORF Transcript_55323/g.147722 Transcript_55323/m.147722 type:complete len:753 (-) Transcript_55323:211-2469(-)
MVKRFKLDPDTQVMVDEARIRQVTEQLFSALGMDVEGATACANVLVDNDLRGNESHGVSYMLKQYTAWLRKGVQNPTPNVRVVRETPGTAVMDGDGALGVFAAQEAMKLAVAKAKDVGVGVVVLRNSGHIGGAGYHAEIASRRGMIGQVFAAPGGGAMCPTFGAEPRFGTHPMAWAAPAKNEAPFLFDAATTQVAGNKIRICGRLGRKVAANWITNAQGEVIREEVDPPEKFFCAPLGGTRENGSHKGYGLACVADLMCNTMSGIGAGFLSGGGGVVLAAFNIEAFTDRGTYDDWVDQFLKGLRTTKPVAGEERVLYPGLNAAETREHRKQTGIPYHPEVMFWFCQVAEELGHAGLREAARQLPTITATEAEKTGWIKAFQGTLAAESMSHQTSNGSSQLNGYAASMGKWRGRDACWAHRPMQLLDGSMGRQLTLNGLPDDDVFRKVWAGKALLEPEWHQEIVKIHKDYIAAGSGAITTSNYGVQPTYFARVFEEKEVDEKLAEYCLIAAQLARRAVEESGKTVRVLGCLPPLTESHRPDLDAEMRARVGSKRLSQYFRTMAAALVKGKVDAIHLETMNSWEEASEALEAVRDLGLPIIVCLEGALRDPVTRLPRPREAIAAARALLDLKKQGVNIEMFGLNCAPPETIHDALRALDEKGLVYDLHEAGILMAAYANVNDRKNAHDSEGFDVRKIRNSREGIKRRDDLAADGWAGYLEFVSHWRVHGVSVVGGCCGCGPEGIEALSAAFSRS